MIRIVFVMMCLACPSWAATVTVRAGEHDTFTRVVFHMPRDSKYRISYIKSGVELRFDERLNLKSDALFTRLYKDRVAAVDLDDAENVITLRTACPCDIHTFREGPTMAVFDIRDTAALPIDTDTITDDQVTSSKDSSEKRAFELPLFLPELVIKDRDPVLDRTKTNLVAALTSAANRRLLNINLTNENPKVSVAEQSIDPSADLAAHVETDFQRGITEQGLRCIDDDKLDLSTWRQDTSFSNNLADLRNRLPLELGDVDPLVALELAKFYTAYGFSAEARRVYDDFALSESPDAPVLDGIIAALNQETTANSVFQNALTCNSRAALWGIMVTDPILPATPIDGNAVQLAFNSLPYPLMEYVGPILIDRLINGDFNDIASLISLQLQRRQRGDTTETEFATAQVLAATGNTEDAIKTLESMADDFSNVSPQALIDLVQLKATQNQMVSPKLAHVAESLMWQHRKSDLAPTLQQTDALAHLLSAEFDRALAKFQTAEKTSEFYDQFVKIATQNAPDSQFIKLVLGNTDISITSVSQTTSLAIADRLADLGFSQAADQFLPKTPIGSVSAEQNLIHAKILLQQNRAHDAIAILEGLENDAAVALRALGKTNLEEWSDFSARDIGHVAPPISAAIALKKSDASFLPPDRNFLLPFVENAKQQNIPMDLPILATVTAETDRSAAFRKNAQAVLEGLESLSDPLRN